jgi:hypothetical protein
MRTSGFHDLLHDSSIIRGWVLYFSRPFAGETGTLTFKETKMRQEFLFDLHHFFLFCLAHLFHLLDLAVCELLNLIEGALLVVFGNLLVF